jgi:hypothetical protein
MFTRKYPSVSLILLYLLPHAESTQSQYFVLFALPPDTYDVRPERFIQRPIEERGRPAVKAFLQIQRTSCQIASNDYCSGLSTKLSTIVEAWLE